MDLVQLAYYAVALGHSPDLEFEADAWAYRTLRKLGRSHDQSMAFTRHLFDYQKQRGESVGRRKPKSVPEAVVQEVDNHFRSHPPTEDRLRRLENMKP